MVKFSKGVVTSLGLAVILSSSTNHCANAFAPRKSLMNSIQPTNIANELHQTSTFLLPKTQSFTIGKNQFDRRSHRRTHNTQLYISNLPANDESGLSYAERSRPFRRDVFSYDLWVKHRSSDRFIGNLLDILKSGVIRQLSSEVMLLSSIALFVCVYNALCVTGYDDFSGVHHSSLANSQYLPLAKMPMDFFTLSTPALALLLGKKVSSETKIHLYLLFLTNFFLLRNALSF